MITANLLLKLGVYIAPEFLSLSECSKLREEMLISPTKSAGTFNEQTRVWSENPIIRSTDYCLISKPSHQIITNKIKAIKPELEQFFNQSFSDDFELPKYLIYREGDFFSPHTDNQINRRINITICLNSQQTEGSNNQHSYQGGSLKFYDLIKAKGFQNRGIEAPAQTGCLIAYPVDVVHEVTRVLSGSRFAIVSRFLSKGQASRGF